MRIGEFFEFFVFMVFLFFAGLFGYAVYCCIVLFVRLLAGV